MDPRSTPDGERNEARTAGPASTDAIVAKLVSNHREFLSFLERRIGDRAVAEDILQDAFVRGLGKAGEVRREESAVAWFYRLLRNAVVDHRRRGESGSRGLESFAAELDASAAAPEEVRAEACRCVRALADTLKPDYANALRRVEVDGVSVAAFAAEAGITANNAAVRVFRAREALRREVMRSCRTCAEHGCLDCSCSPRA